MNKIKKIIYLLLAFIVIIVLLDYVSGYKPRYFINGKLSQGYILSENSDTLLNIGTFNSGILYSKIFGITYFEPTPYSKRRLKYLPEYLRQLNLDVIGIQEIYKKSDKDYLIRELKEDYPYCIYYEKVRDVGFGLDNGLLFISKMPISCSKFSTFKHNPLLERLLTDKGILSIKVDVSGDNIIITNTHTTVGGVINHTESTKANKIRNKQILQVLNMSSSFNLENQIILGDFNAGPGVSEINYKLLTESGYKDTYTFIYKDNRNGVTWDPENSFNNTGYYSDSPPQRIDNIFLSENTLRYFEITDCEIILDKTIFIVDEIEYTLSDHYGYFISLIKKDR